jgi:protein involved in polysaccharide export with SLBB domain
MQFSERKICYLAVGVFFFLLHSFAAAQTEAPVEEKNSASLEIIQVEHAAAEPVSPEPESVPADKLVHFGDLIDVDVLGTTEYDWRGRLNPEGFLNGINFVEEPIYGLCRTEAEIAADIAEGFSKLLRNPQVVVRVIDRSGRPESVLYGAVRNSQRFQIRRPVRLNELLILSGGITDKASGEIQILRPPNLSCQPRSIEPEDSETTSSETKEKIIPARQDSESQFINIKISDLLKGDRESNPYIFSGDVITVLEAEPIYVIGGVANPRQIIATPQLTVSRAVAAAGGLAKDADPKRITVFRREKRQTKLIEINLEKIEASPEADIILQPLDIVEVARRGREKNKFPPIINTAQNSSERRVNLPLRIID